MKKQLLILSFAFIGAGFLMAGTKVDSPWSATNTATDKATATINYCDCAPTIDGKMNEAVWNEIALIPIDRPMINELPSLWSAYYKAFWNDTAIFILGVAVDDNFWPSWKSGQADWASDKFELYFDGNGITTATLRGASDGGVHGFYQVTHNYDMTPDMGTIQAGTFAGTLEANTWQFSSGLLKYDTLITEWCVPFKVLKDSNGIAVVPINNYTIGFDCYFIDLDSATDYDGRQRQVWSNTNPGGLGENWNNMSDAGLITFSTAGLIDTIPPTVSISSIPADTIHDAFNITITFSEKVVGFTASDLNITNGTSKPGTFTTTNNIVFTDKIIPTSAGIVTIGIDAGKCTDLSSNANLAATPINVTYAPDLTPPSVTITSSPTDTVAGIFNITITFSEQVSGFSASDLTITNGVSKTGTFLSADSIVFTDRITPTAAGDVTIGIDAAKCTDLNSNANLAATPITVYYKKISGVGNTQLSSINFYPNPVHGVLYYDISGFSGTSEFSIYNMIGSLVYQNTTADSKGSFDLSSINSGAFVMKVQNGTEVLVKKLIVK